MGLLRTKDKRTVAKLAKQPDLVAEFDAAIAAAEADLPAFRATVHAAADPIIRALAEAESLIDAGDDLVSDITDAARKLAVALQVPAIAAGRLWPIFEAAARELKQLYKPRLAVQLKFRAGLQKAERQALDTLVIAATAVVGETLDDTRALIDNINSPAHIIFKGERARQVATIRDLPEWRAWQSVRAAEALASAASRDPLLGYRQLRADGADLRKSSDAREMLRSLVG